MQLWHRKRRKCISGTAIAVIAGALLCCQAPVALAAAFTVDTVVDAEDANPGDGVCDDGSAHCTLRAAIMEANASPGLDAIALPMGTYSLTLGSELSIDQSLSLTGEGAEFTIIQAHPELNMSRSRVLDISGGVVGITGLSIRHGNPSFDETGGGIQISAGTVILTRCTVSHNQGGFGFGFGGGIYNAGTLLLSDSLVSENLAFGKGGGIYNTGTLGLNRSVVKSNTADGFYGDSGAGGIYNSGSLALVDSTVSDNLVEGRLLIGHGGGIYNRDGSVSLSNSLVSNNTSSGLGGNSNGGGIYNALGGGPVTLTNSTVTGNAAPDSSDGGGIFNWGVLTLVNTTISDNTATRSGGGIHAMTAVELVNTIVARNTAPSGAECSGPLVSLGHNLLSHDGGCAFVAAPGDRVGTPGSPIDPMLGPLQFNRGLTDTRALLPGSPAIDAGDDGAAPTDDQRGVPRPQGAASDIGAYEFDTAPVAVDEDYEVDEDGTLTVDAADGVLANDRDPEDEPLTAILIEDVRNGTLALNPDGSFVYTPMAGFSGSDSFAYRARDESEEVDLATTSIRVFPLSPLTVTRTDDSFDGVCDADCSLRDAIAAAKDGSAVDVPAGTYTLRLGSELAIERNLSLSGAGADSTIIQAGTAPEVAAARVFNIRGGDVTLSGVAIRHGNLMNHGGGIFNAGQLTVADSAVSGNAAIEGGGVYNEGELTVTNSILENNTAARPDFFSEGGGLFNQGTALLLDSTVRGNHADDGGGGIRTDSALSLIVRNSTVSGNTSEFGAAGIDSFFNNVTVANSTISGNVSERGTGGIEHQSETFTLINSTVAANLGDTDDPVNPGDPGGILLRSSGNILLANTLVALNTGAGAPDCAGAPTSLGHNLIGDATGCGFVPVAGDLVGTEADPVAPRLSPLRDNGGPTATHALLRRSPAIDAAHDLTCALPPVGGVDQRGVARPQGPACDIGSFEAGPPPVVLTLGYRFWMSDGSSGAGTYSLFANGEYADESGLSGSWLFWLTPPRIVLRYDAGFLCEALSIGRVVTPSLIQGPRICRDGSGVRGVWVGTVSEGFAGK